MVQDPGPHSVMPSSGRNLGHWRLYVKQDAGLPTMGLINLNVRVGLFI